MNLPNQTCLPIDKLKAMLAESLPEPEQLSAYLHIEECQSCQSQLDELTEVDDRFTSGSSLEQGTSTLRALMDRLKSTSAIEQIREGTVDTQNTKQTSLSPSDRSTLYGPDEPSFSKPTLIELSEPPFQVEGYRIVQLIGQGASGKVFKAIDKSLGRTVAIKFLQGPIAQTEHGRRRAKQEAKATAAIEHPNIVRLYQFGTTPTKTDYIVFEFVDGKSLDQMLSEKGNLSAKLAAEIVSQVATGMSAAHNNNLIHRDLKPSNILLDSKEQAKVVDFGLALDLENDTRITQDGWVAGTPAYMSPEHIVNHKQVDKLSDVYGLGIVLYELLTGEVPFRGLSKATIGRIIDEEPKSLRLINPSVPGELDTICLKSISKNRSDRYASMSEFCDDIQRWIDGEPILAKPISTFEKFIKRVKKYPVYTALWTSVSGLAAALFFGAIATSVYLSNANRDIVKNEKIASQQRDALLETLQQLVYKVNDQVEREYVDQDQLQTELLKISLAGLNKVADSSKKLSVVDRRTADVHYRLGMVLYRLDSVDDSLRHFEQAYQISNKLLEKRPTSQSLREFQIQCVWGISNVLSENADEVDAVRQFEVANQITSDYVKSHRGKLEPTTYLAWSDGKLGQAEYYYQIDDLKNAINEYDSTRQILSDSGLLVSSQQLQNSLSDQQFEAADILNHVFIGLSDSYFEMGNETQAAHFDALQEWNETMLRLMTMGESSLSNDDFGYSEGDDPDTEGEEPEYIEGMWATEIFLERKLRKLGQRKQTVNIIRAQSRHLVSLCVTHWLLEDTFKASKDCQRAHKILSSLIDSNSGSESEFSQLELKMELAKTVLLSIRLTDDRNKKIELTQQLGADLDKLGSMVSDEIDLRQVAKLRQQLITLKETGKIIGE